MVVNYLYPKLTMGNLSIVSNVNNFSLMVNWFFQFFSKRDSSLFPVLEGAEILTQKKNHDCVKSIRQSAGLSDSLFDLYYQSSLLAVAELLQSTPGSEGHHHAWPGGLITHVLESAANSLRFRKQITYPAGGEAEEKEKKRDLFTYAVFASAILHDIAKPLTDQRIGIYNRWGQYLRDWNPAVECIRDVPKAKYVRIEFRRNRVYTHHQNSSLLFAQRVLPACGFQWIESDPEIYGEFLDSFSSDPVGQIYPLVKKGDQLSVSRALGAQRLPNFAGSGDRPLWMKIRSALRYMIASGDLTLNRGGAAGWVDSRGVWLVSKRVLDAVRDYLHKEGHAGIPGDNNRLMDVISESGLAVMNDEGKAIWRCFVISENWKSDVPLTLLRFSHDDFWNDPASIPLFDGEIREETEGQSSSEKASIENVRVVEGESGESFGKAESTADEVAIIPLLEHPNEELKQSAESSAGELFRKWIEDGVNHDRPLINRKGQRVVHGWKYGVFIVSPEAFKIFAESRKLDWMEVQRDFQRLRINVINQAERGENWWEGRFSPKAGKFWSVKGWVVPYEHFAFAETMDINEDLVIPKWEN